MSKIARTKIKVVDHCWTGILIGLFSGCFLTTVLTMFFLWFYGLKVSINPERIADLVRTRVQDKAKVSICQIVEGFKNELSLEIIKNLDNQPLSLGVGNNQLQVPIEVTNTNKEDLNRIIEDGVYNVINGYNTSRYEARLGWEAYQSVENILKQRLIGRKYLVSITDWFSVPVKIVNESEQGVEDEFVINP